MNADADLITNAIEDFHYRWSEHVPGEGLPERHGEAWSDSLAMTHCICWGAATAMLMYLLEHPERFDALRQPSPNASPSSPEPGVGR